MIRKHMRHIKRYREIVSVLVKYGFGYIVKDVGLMHLLSLPKQMVSDFTVGGEDRPVGRRIRTMLEELGPTFIKLGQMLSLRNDLIPEPVAAELRGLQDRVTPVDSRTVDRLIQNELGAPPDEIFKSFDKQCLAAASIGQVHRAVLKTGEDVAVKIRRPNIETIVGVDVEILRDLAYLIEKRYARARDLQIRDIVEEFSAAIQNEMDYFREGRNTEKLYNFFENNTYVVIPKVFWPYSTGRLLTLEYISGLKCDELIDKPHEAIDNKIVSERLVRSFLDQALVIGVFHGDPHPGNLRFFPDNKVGYLDFGQVGMLSDEMKRYFADLIIGLMRGDIDLLARTVYYMSSMPEHLDEDQFKTDLEVLRDKYYNLPFRDIHIGKVMTDLFAVTKKHSIRIPKNYTLLAKALITLEGIITSLDNQISILELAEPYGRKLYLDRFDPEKVLRTFIKSFSRNAEIALQIPDLLNKTLKRLDKGKTRVEMKLPQLHMLLMKLDRAANRITFSIILLSCSIVLAGLILGEALGAAPLFGSIQVLGIAAAVLIVMMFVILIAIFRSGRF